MGTNLYMIIIPYLPVVVLPKNDFMLPALLLFVFACPAFDLMNNHNVKYNSIRNCSLSARCVMDAHFTEKINMNCCSNEFASKTAEIHLAC